VSGGVGAQLRAEREARGLTVEQVAAETRIPMRHLLVIEDGDFQHLPARTYAVGFVRSYAKMLGLDSSEMVGRVREELDAQPQQTYSRPATFEPGDPARVPSRGLFWLAILAGLVVVVLAYLFMRSVFTPAAELPSLVEQQQQEEAAQAAARAAQGQPAAAATPSPTGPVVFTSREEGVWVKFYDAAGRQLMQKQMVLGETYTVPADANGPQIWTGRPDALTITVGGQEIAPLAAQQRIMRDIPVDAQSLLARAGAAQQPPAAPAATGQPGATPAASPTG